MILSLDRCWLRVLGAAHGWLLRGAQAHYRREILRRVRRHVAWQRAELN